MKKKTGHFLGILAESPDFRDVRGKRYPFPAIFAFVIIVPKKLRVSSVSSAVKIQF